MRPISVTRTLANAAVGAVAAAQTTAGAGNLLINGSLASGGVATLAAQQTLGFTSAGNIAGVVFTITGTDDQNRVISETVTGVNANTVNTVLSYRTVTRISASAAVTSAVSVDTLQIGGSQEIPVDIYLTPFNVTIAVEVSGVVNYTVQWTLDDVFAPPGGGPFVWNNSTVLGTTNQVGSLVSPVRALRLLTNSGGGTAKLIAVQAGVMG